MHHSFSSFRLFLKPIMYFFFQIKHKKIQNLMLNLLRWIGKQSVQLLFLNFHFKSKFTIVWVSERIFKNIMFQIFPVSIMACRLLFDTWKCSAFNSASFGAHPIRICSTFTLHLTAEVPFLGQKSHLKVPWWLSYPGPLFS